MFLSEHIFAKYRHLSNASQVFLLPEIWTEEEAQAGILTKAGDTSFFWEQHREQLYTKVSLIYIFQCRPVVHKPSHPKVSGHKGLVKMNMRWLLCVCIYRKKQHSSDCTALSVFLLCTRQRFFSSYIIHNLLQGFHKASTYPSHKGSGEKRIDSEKKRF